MNEFRQNLLRDFIGPLDDLHARISVENSKEIRDQAFRLIHSVKGCSRTFGLRRSAELAAEIECALAEESVGETRNAPLLERLKLLIETLKHPETATEDAGQGFESANGTRRAVCLCRLPAPLFDQLTESERSALVAALASGRSVSNVRRSLDSNRFPDEFRRIRCELEAAGNVIAALPDPKADGPYSGLVFLVSIDPGSPDLSETADVIDAPPDANGQISQFLEGVADHISRVAAEAGKSVGLAIVADDRALDPDLTRPIFEILIHLASNAVDHGIQRAGKIEISMLRDGSNVVITLVDNGRGIGTEETPVDAKAAIARIFEPGFSAGNGMNSGCGYGLSVVATEVAKLNGKISVKTRKDFGTRFEIVVPV